MNRIKNSFRILFIVFSFLSVNSFAQDGGMWIPSLIKDLNIDDMQKMGLKLNADDIYAINKSSLKDAIVHFGGGCTGEIISSEGLLLTNHHCGYGQIQSHSSIENNYLKDGFWAKSKAEELTNPGLTATFIVRIEDVTNKVLKGTQNIEDINERESAIDKNIQKVKSQFKIEDYQSVSISSFFKGNQYFAFVKETYKDVRLVGAPPSMIGKFGSDTDNWVWPRHTGDFSLFRVYANKNNKPAEYSADNVPLKPKHFLPISLDGVQEGDFTMVYGFPGRTDEYLPAVAIKQLVEVINPERINIRDVALKLVDKDMRADEAIKIKYASKYAGIANYWKKWIGENKGLIASHAVEKRMAFEKEYTQRLSKNKKANAKYGHILKDFENLYSDIQNYEVGYNAFSEIAFRNVEILKLSMNVNGAFDKLKSVPDSVQSNYYNSGLKDAVMKYASNLYKNYEANVDKKVFESLLKIYVENIDKDFHTPEFLNFLDNYKADYSALADDVFSNSYLVDEAKFSELLNSQDLKQLYSKLDNDPVLILSKLMRDEFSANIQPKYQQIKGEISELQRLYMKSLIELFPEKKFYPDANSTLRITWGKVDGYEPMDGVYYEPKTHLSGIIEKHKDGDYEFDVPVKLQQLYKDHDFGIYEENGDVPVAFIATNHTTGGNSGSPALDAHGNLIGLNFDRVWEGTMSDINYDANICRNIMVDVKYVLFIIDKYGDAKYLLDEMKLVRPKYYKQLELK